MKVEYGIMSNKWEITAKDEKQAIAAIVVLLGTNAKLAVIYSPQEMREKEWAFSFAENLEARLDEIFGGKGKFMVYLDSHVEEMREVVKTHKVLV